MAVTKILPIRTTIQKSVDYICNPDKTDGSLLIHAEHCFQQTAGLTFHHHLNQCRAGGNTIGRHLIQSFAPGEVDPATAHEIGKKLATEILGGEYAFVLATHVDRGHVHNHFVWGAANIVTRKRYRSNVGTYHAIRNISDRLCKENSLSIIVPDGIGKSYAEHTAEQSGTSWKGKLKNVIDTTLSESADFEDFIKRMESQGYAVKRGKHISFQAPEQTRFTRAKSLGATYTEEAIKERITSKTAPTTTATPATSTEHRGLEQWAKIQDLKDTAAAFALMQEYGGLEAFNELYTSCRIAIETAENGINANEERITALKYFRDDIANYKRTLPIYRQYTEMKKAKNNITFFGKNRAEEFRMKYEEDIFTHEVARRDLADYAQPLPNVKTITAEIQKIEAANVRNKQWLPKKKAELRQLTSIHKHLHFLRREHEPPPLEQPPPKRTRNRSYDMGL